MLTERVALVTGSTSGIGRGIAERLACAGADVMLNGRRPADQAIEAFRHDLERRCGVRTAYAPADIGQGAAVDGLIEETERSFGRLDILINNAGIQHTAPLETFPVEQWEAILAINLTAAFRAIRAALPGMRRRNFGRIINVASAHGLVASREKAAYVAAKHGLIGLTKVVALETAETAITCNAICPGWVLTPLVEAQIAARAAREAVAFESAAAALLREKQPSGRFVTAEDVGETAVFLCSAAAQEIRGHALAIDGGWLAQ